MFDEYIDSLKNDIVRETCNLINIPSVSIETQNPDMPFGEGAKKALDYALNLGNCLGFRTKNIDNYCGYIEFGEGENLLGIIGHLDVVPSGDGWDTPPFSSTIKNGKIFGGVSSKEIAEELQKVHNISVDKKKIDLKEPIKELGTTNVEIKLFEGVTGVVKVNVVSEE